ncbi:potassium channel subfamily K member 1-like isoform X1 [Tachypleus tridentatus]|uniref:potassium channel subfamily K member 1-like isoform X1 n=1 Tax=Tachypleus tridentatus TaxID=6853 RepID=UPI003FD17C45
MLIIVAVGLHLYISFASCGWLKLPGTSWIIMACFGNFGASCVRVPGLVVFCLSCFFLTTSLHKREAFVVRKNFVLLSICVLWNIQGYGHVTPLSRGGRVFCIVYALLGIPLTLILLTAYVERLMIPITWFLHFLNSKFGHLYQSFNIRMIHFAAVAAAIITLFFLIPAAIFSYLEPDWDYLDSIYYCFISLTTIGLGDYIPGEGADHTFRPLYKVCVTFYLLIGLVFMMLLLAVLYSIPQLNLGIFFLLKSDELADTGSETTTTSTTGTRYIKPSS